MAKRRQLPPPEPSPEDKKAVARLNSLVLTAEEETGEVQADGLTLRQQAFVKAITGPAFMNPVKAAEMAGYNAENRSNLSLCANRNLNAPHVARAIRLTLAKKFREDPEWLDNEAYVLATTTMNEFLDIKTGPDGEVIQVGIDFAKAMRTGAIAAVKDMEFDRETGACTKVKLHDRLQAMEFYAKLTGRLKDDGGQKGPIQINVNVVPWGADTPPDVEVTAQEVKPASLPPQKPHA